MKPHNIDDLSDPVQGYTERIQRTMSLLKALRRRPDLITITRSEANGNLPAFVPEELVDKVEQQLVQKLQQLYG